MTLSIATTATYLQTQQQIEGEQYTNQVKKPKKRLIKAKK
jgi:hypothetical protein